MPDHPQIPRPAADHLPLSEAEAALAYVRDLQRDGRLLLRHVARRTDRSVAPATSAAAPALEVLTAEAASIVRDGDRLELLAATVDALSRQAAPATASTIRLTSAYLRLASEGGEPPREVEQRVRRVRAVIMAIMGVTMLAMACALVLLAHVDDGRRAAQQLEQVRVELKATYAELGTLPPAAWVVATAQAPGAAPGAATPTPTPTATPVPADFLPFCPVVAPGDAPPPQWRAPATTAEGARAQALCSRLWEASMREQLTFLRLQAWNCRNNQLFNWGFLRGDGCGTVPGTPPELKGLVSARDWDRTEMRTNAAISNLTGFVLPLVLGCIGGCAYVLRRLDQKLSEATLEVRDGWHAGLRVLLATMMGGLLGAVWSGDQQVHLGGYALSLAAAAFFVGFALEAVFTIIEAMVEGVAGKLRAPPPGTTVVVQAPRAAPPAAERPVPPPAERPVAPVALRPAE